MPTNPKKANVLLVGLSEEEVRHVPARLMGSKPREAQRVSLDDLESSQIVNATTVISPLICSEFDVLDLALRLTREGFEGHYISFATEMIDITLVRSEVAAAVPDLLFDVISMREGVHVALETHMH